MRPSVAGKNAANVPQKYSLVCFLVPTGILHIIHSQQTLAEGNGIQFCWALPPVPRCSKRCSKFQVFQVLLPFLFASPSQAVSFQELGPRIDQLGAQIRSANVELNKNKAVPLANWKKFVNLLTAANILTSFWHSPDDGQSLFYPSAAVGAPSACTRCLHLSAAHSKQQILENIQF